MRKNLVSPDYVTVDIYAARLLIVDYVYFGCSPLAFSNDVFFIKTAYSVSQMIPIEGHFKYNDEQQNTYKSIQTEIVVSM